MEHDQAIEAVTRSVNELDDQLAAGHSLDDIADGLKLRLIKIPAIDVKGTTPDGKIPSEFPDKEQMLKDAFAQNTAETSPIEDDKAGHYYVVRTDDITPSTPKPFDSVKAQVTDAWKAHQQMMKAQAFAQQINKDLQDGKPLASFADQNAVSVRTSLPLSLLDDTDPLLPHSVITQAFRIKKGETTTGTDGNKIVVARLASITDVPSASDDIHKNKIEGEIKQATSDELLDQYIQYLHTVFPVKINAELVGQMRQQDN
jgi:peptidyl-prolyl cis-trans isomerase D